jgi:hypothetical protein
VSGPGKTGGHGFGATEGGRIVVGGEVGSYGNRGDGVHIDDNSSLEILPGASLTMAHNGGHGLHVVPSTPRPEPTPWYQRPTGIVLLMVFAAVIAGIILLLVGSWFGSHQ